MLKSAQSELEFFFDSATSVAWGDTSVACNSIINQAQDNNVSSVVEFQRLEVCMYLKTKIFEKKCHNLEFRIKNGLCLMIFGKIGILLQNCSDLLCEKIEKRMEFLNKIYL